jgi:predicted extracellular nuclease
VNTLTEAGARIMVQHLVRSFVDATEVEESSQEWVLRARRLQDQLGGLLGVTPTAADIEELVTSYEELESIEYGTHQDLKVNLTLTINNAPELAEALHGRIERETTDLLENAGFGKKVAA